MRSLSSVPTSLVLAGALVACGDDGSRDRSADTLGETTTSADVADDSAADTAPETVSQELVVTTGPQGRIRVYNDAVLAELFAASTTILWPPAPECALNIHDPHDAYAAAGTLTVGGEIVGPGGLSQPLELGPGGSNLYEYFAPVFAKGDTRHVEVSLAGNATFPELTTHTYRPPAGFVTITEPAPPTQPPEMPQIDLHSDEDIDIGWQVPAGDVSEHQILFGMHFIQGSRGLEGMLYCGFPMADGHGTVPAKLITELSQRVGEAGAGGFIHIAAGDGERLMVDDTLYLVEVTWGSESTTWLNEFFVHLD